VTLLLLVVGLGVLAYQAVRTGLALRQAEAEATTLRTTLADGDLDAAETASDRLAARTEVAREQSDGVLWAAATYVPLVGDDVRAVRQLSSALDELAGRAAGPALAAARTVAQNPLRGDDGAFDVSTARALQTPLAEASAAAGRAAADLREVDPAGLIGPLRPRAAEFKEQVTQLDAALSVGTTATELLPAMLGAEGERTYLLVVQNNAEVRATGGLPGSISVLRARGDRHGLAEQGSAADFGPPDSPPAARLSADETRLLGADMATDFRDTNFTPDFPRAASLMATMADRRLDDPVDGVVSIDPVALAGVLKGTGPIEAAGTRLDAGNVVRRLLFDPYQQLAGDREHNAYFRATSAAIFDALLRGSIDERTVLAELAAGVQQRRLLVWSKRPEEQQALEAAGLAGALPDDRSDRPDVGFYLNSGTQAKIQYFLRYDGRVRSLGCDAGGRQVVQARFRLRSDVPTPVSQLDPYVSGLGDEADQGVNLVNLAMYAPTGGRLTALQVDGAAARVASGKIDDRGVAVLPIELKPGESAEVVADFTTRRGQDGAPRMQWTPGMASGPTQDVAPSRCG
jgi:hypothetical protein